MDLGNFSTREERYGDIGGGDGFREFGDGQDVVGVEGEENVVEGAAQGLDRNPNGFKAILIIHNATPSGTGEADLV
jgi:hypothetical protein